MEWVGKRVRQRPDQNALGKVKFISQIPILFYAWHPAKSLWEREGLLAMVATSRKKPRELAKILEDDKNWTVEK
jgi:hypothetical protein